MLPIEVTVSLRVFAARVCRACSLCLVFSFRGRQDDFGQNGGFNDVLAAVNIS